MCLAHDKDKRTQLWTFFWIHTIHRIFGHCQCGHHLCCHHHPHHHHHYHYTFKVLAFMAIPVNIAYTKFIGLIVDKNLTWKNHIELLISRLSAVCSTINPTIHVSAYILIIIYYALFRSIMTYSIIFWGNSTHNSKIFKIQKRAIRR
jgi:hypothetical protein